MARSNLIIDDAMVTAPELLRVDSLAVSYGRAVTGLRNGTFELRQGEVVALLGANGAGKSTLLRAISGVLSAYRGNIESGTISLRGQSTIGLSARELTRAGVALVPEGRRVFSGMTVEENLRAGTYAARSRKTIAAARERVLDLFPVLRERRGQYGGLLSGGEQQMLAIGRALMGDPQLLLLDEPSLGLAPKMVDSVGEIVDQINAQGTSVLLVEQNASMALEHSSRAYVLEVGVISSSGASTELAASGEIQELYLGSGGAKRATKKDQAMKLSKWEPDE